MVFMMNIHSSQINPNTVVHGFHDEHSLFQNPPNNVVHGFHDEHSLFQNQPKKQCNETKTGKYISIILFLNGLSMISLKYK